MKMMLPVYLWDWNCMQNTARPVTVKSAKVMVRKPHHLVSHVETLLPMSSKLKPMEQSFT